MTTLLILYTSLLKAAFCDTTWHYGDQSDWGNNYPQCNTDRDESPINILEENAIIDTKKCIPKFEWTIDETHNRFKVINNGESLIVRPVTTDNTRVQKSIATFPNYFHPTNHDLTYCLESFHFHWGVSNTYGSEHQIENKSYPLEAHFVHYSCEYNNVSHALHAYANDKDDHILAVVAVLFEISDTDKHNEAFDIILSENVFDNIWLPNSTYVNNLRVNELIPATLDLNVSGYYYYEGSLTIPPCDDIVRWNVMNTFGYVSNKQMMRLRQLYSNENKSIAPNFRHIQYNENDLFGCVPTSDENVIGENDDNTLNTLDIILIVACSVLVILLVLIIFVFCKYKKKLFGKNDGNYQQMEL
eukprot:403288_1